MKRDVGRYRKIYPRIFRHPGFRGLKESTQTLVLYLLAGPQTNGIGLFHLSVATAAEDLGVSSETIRKGLTDVAGTFGWLYDADARVFYIPSWWRWNAPENPNVLRGNLKSLHEIPPCALVDAFARNISTLEETLHATFVECCRQRLPKRSGDQEQYQYLEQEQEHATRKTVARVDAASLRERKSGTDRKGLLQIARDVLAYTNPEGTIEHLVDTFFQLKPNACSKAEAIESINDALNELRERRARIA